MSELVVEAPQPAVVAGTMGAAAVDLNPVVSKDPTSLDSKVASLSDSVAALSLEKQAVATEDVKQMDEKVPTPAIKEINEDHHADVDDKGFYDEVEIEDMDYDESLEAYFYPCPCGDKFTITKEQLRDGEEIARCPSCTLIIKVIYDPDDFGGSEDESSSSDSDSDDD